MHEIVNWLGRISTSAEKVDRNQEVRGRRALVFKFEIYDEHLQKEVATLLLCMFPQLFKQRDRAPVEEQQSAISHMGV